MDSQELTVRCAPNEMLLRGLSSELLVAKSTEALIGFLAWRGDLPEDSLIDMELHKFTRTILSYLLEDSEGLDTLGPISLDQRDFINELGHRIGNVSDDKRLAVRSEAWTNVADATTQEIIDGQ